MAEGNGGANGTVAHRLILVAHNLAVVAVDLGVHAGALHEGGDLAPAALSGVADRLDEISRYLREPS
jgi:hypothetical protein